MTDEKQDLDNLTKHPGWLRLVEHGLKEIDGRVQTAMTNAAGERDDIMALNQLRQCIAAKQAIEALIAWPTSRLNVLIETEKRNDPQWASKGGFSRRGGL